MSSTQGTSTSRSESPDPSSHAVNMYDIAEAENEWVDEDDDMDYEPTTDESEDNDFFDPAEEDVEAEFHGKYSILWLLAEILGDS